MSQTVSSSGDGSRRRPAAHPDGTPLTSDENLAWEQVEAGVEFVRYPDRIDLNGDHPLAFSYLSPDLNYFTFFVYFDFDGHDEKFEVQVYLRAPGYSSGNWIEVNDSQLALSFRATPTLVSSSKKAARSKGRTLTSLYDLPGCTERIVYEAKPPTWLTLTLKFGTNGRSSTQLWTKLRKRGHTELDFDFKPQSVEMFNLPKIKNQHPNWTGDVQASVRVPTRKRGSGGKTSRSTTDGLRGREPNHSSSCPPHPAPQPRA